MPPEGPPVWTALNRAGARDPAPDFLDDAPQGDAHGDFHQPGVFYLAHQGEDLGAGAVGHPDFGVPLGPMVDDIGDVGPGLDVVDHGGAGPQAFFHRVGGPGYGFAHPALNGGQEGGFLPADKGAGAAADVDIEIEPRSQDVPAQESQGAGLVDGDLESPHRKGVFGPDIEVALFGAHGPGPDGHAFQNGMGVAFHDGPVHEGARVAFVAVGDDEDRPRVFPGIFHHLSPLKPGGEAAPAPAPQAGDRHGIDNLVRGHLAQDLDQGAVGPGLEGIVNIQGVDEPHIFENDLLL